MERFSFRYDHGNYDEAEYYESSLAFSVENAYLWDILEKIEQFLRGSGFVFDGNLRVVAKNEMIVPTSFVNDSINKDAYRHSDVGSPVEVTKGAEFGINITDVGQTAV